MKIKHVGEVKVPNLRRAHYYFMRQFVAIEDDVNHTTFIAVLRDGSIIVYDYNDNGKTWIKEFDVICARNRRVKSFIGHFTNLNDMVKMLTRQIEESKNSTITPINEKTGCEYLVWNFTAGVKLQQPVMMYQIGPYTLQIPQIRICKAIPEHAAMLADVNGSFLKAFEMANVYYGDPFLLNLEWNNTSPTTLFEILDPVRPLLNLLNNNDLKFKKATLDSIQNTIAIILSGDSDLVYSRGNGYQYNRDHDDEGLL